jgi:cytoskeletal protein CcmA (bactofilin family)
MSTAFILFFISAIVAVVLGLTGIVILINGFVKKDDKLVWRGSIITGITLILIVSGVFCGAHKCVTMMQKHRMNKEIRCEKFEMDHCNMMSGDSMMMNDTTSGNDTNGMKMKCNHMKKMDCEKGKCDHEKCKSKCPHEKQ